MSVQQFLLKWNNHQPNFISVFKDFLSNKSLVDVTLSTEGKQIYAHKVVLSACSVYFQALFAENPSNHPIVILKDVKYSDLEILVDFIYCGQVNVSEEQLPQLLETAKTLKIKGLIEMPEASLTRSHGAAGEATAGEEEPQARQTSPPAPQKVLRRRRSLSDHNISINATGEHSVKLESGAAAGGAAASSAARCLNQIQHADVSQQTEDQANTQEHLMMESLNQGDWNLCANAFASGGLQEGVASSSSGNYMAGCVGNNNAAGGSGNFMSFGINNGGASGSGAFMMGCGGGTENSYGNSQVQTNNHDPLAPPRRRRRSVNPQADHKFIAALEAVRFGGIGFCKAARIFGVNNRTLWLEYKRRGYPNNRPSIKNRIKRENSTPNPEVKQEIAIPDHLMPIQEEPLHAVPEQEMPLVCQSNSLPVGYMNARNANFALQGMMQNNQPLNLHGINFNPNTMQ